jgi:hypothetical protein
MTDVRMAATIFADGKQPECVVSTRDFDDWGSIGEVVEGYVEMLHTRIGTLYVNEDATTLNLPANFAATRLVDWLFPEAETVEIRGNVVVDVTNDGMMRLVEAALFLRTLKSSAKN